MYIVCVATDYDGTLAHDRVVDESTIEALDAFKRTGRKLILATGRELPDLARIFARLDLAAGAWRAAADSRYPSDGGKVRAAYPKVRCR